MKCLVLLIMCIVILLFIFLEISVIWTYTEIATSLTANFIKKLVPRKSKAFSPHSLILPQGFIYHLFSYVFIRKLKHGALASISYRKVRGIIGSSNISENMRKMSPFLSNWFFFSEHAVKNQKWKTHEVLTLLVNNKLWYE